MLVYVENSNESVKHQYVRLARSQGYKVNIQKNRSYFYIQ